MTTYTPAETGHLLDLLFVPEATPTGKVEAIFPRYVTALTG
jgi:hypothetical protein